MNNYLKKTRDSKNISDEKISGDFLSAAYGGTRVHTSYIILA